jgi:S-formylglutathione hydrolase FrmB
MSRTIVLAAALLAACAAPHAAPESPPPPAAAKPVAAPPATTPAAHGTVEKRSFHSDALGVDKDYIVYLPADYASATDKRYPVIYLLHGLGGDETNWVDHGRLVETADAMHLEAIVVMPDGDASFYADSVAPADYEGCMKGRRFLKNQRAEKTCVKHADYEKYMTVDLIADVDTTYRAIADRKARGIGGLSMGGFGALMLAMRHQDLYSAAASHSGVDALLYAGPHPYEKSKVVLAEDVSQWGKEVEPIGGQVRGIFGPHIDNWRAHDPAELAQSLKPGALAIYLDAGLEDDFLLNDGASYLHDVLGAAGVKHAFTLAHGHHNFAFWQDRIDDSLSFFVATFASNGY